jgi:16S rRNA (uracil1498-N3)-methyltransferase
VLRQKAGDSVILFDGSGGEHQGVITHAGNKSVAVSLDSFSANNPESPLQTSLGIGISRGERFEWVLQKATELGVTEIYPLFTERTEVKLKGEREEKKQSRWQQVIVSACEQSGRTLLPTLHPPQNLADFLGIETDKKFLLHHRSSTTLAALQNEKPSSVALLIGPEGGLSPAEIEAGRGKSFEALTLGPRVFRTETAPIVALSIFQSLWGDF